MARCRVHDTAGRAGLRRVGGRNLDERSAAIRLPTAVSRRWATEDSPHMPTDVVHADADASHTAQERHCRCGTRDPLVRPLRGNGRRTLRLVPVRIAAGRCIWRTCRPVGPTGLEPAPRRSQLSGACMTDGAPCPAPSLLGWRGEVALTSDAAPSRQGPCASQARRGAYRTPWTRTASGIRSNDTDPSVCVDILFDTSESSTCFGSAQRWKVEAGSSDHKSGSAVLSASFGLGRVDAEPKTLEDLHTQSVCLVYVARKRSLLRRSPAGDRHALRGAITGRGFLPALNGGVSATEIR